MPNESVVVHNVRLEKSAPTHLVIKFESGRPCNVDRSELISTDLVHPDDVGYVEITKKLASRKGLA